ncbi:restriction endonuclease subunit S [Vibrio cholerae]|uniref:restriction endonuclease subunit S n=1 Tax=Vibrio cholerae TaxID=666 RepID=UPI003D3494EA
MEQVLYKLPDGWEWHSVKKLSHNIQYGHTAKAESNGNAKFLRITDIQDGKIDWQGVPTVSLEEKEISKYALNDDDLIFARSGATAGKSILIKNAPKDAVFASYLIRIVPNKKDIIPEYLSYFFLTPAYWEVVGQNAAGAAQPNINGTKLSEFIVPVAPQGEQKRIVEKLDALLTRIDTAIEHLQQSATLADALYASELNEIFNPRSLPINQSGIYELPHGWEWKRIEDVFTITSGKNLTKKYMHVEGKFSVYGGNGIAGRYNDFNLSGSNIIIGRVGALCGNVRLVHGDIWVTDNAFFIKEYKVDILKEYLEKVLSALNLGETANKAAQPVISYKGIKDLVIPYPPLDEQQRIVEKINNIGKLQVALKKQLQFKTSSLGQLKSSILDSAFKGKL